MKAGQRRTACVGLPPFVPAHECGNFGRTDGLLRAASAARAGGRPGRAFRISGCRRRRRGLQPTLRGGKVRRRGRRLHARHRFRAVPRPRSCQCPPHAGAEPHGKGRADRAIADFTAAIRLDPTRAAAHQGRGESHLAQGNEERALPDLNETIRLDPKSVTAFVYRGAILGARGEHDRAISDFTAAIQIEPFSAELRARRPMPTAARKTMSARWQTRTSPFSSTPTPPPPEERGHIFHSKAQYDRAIEDLTAAIRLEPDNYSAYLVRGGAYRHKRDYDRALADASAMIRLDPNTGRDIRPRHELHDTGKFDQAIADFETAMQSTQSGRNPTTDAAVPILARAIISGRCPTSTRRSARPSRGRCLLRPGRCPSRRGRPWRGAGRFERSNPARPCRWRLLFQSRHYV